MTRVLALFAAAALLASASGANAASCRDAAGKFIACPAKATTTAHKGPCRDSTGKFTACPAKSSASATPATKTVKK
jgi:hypothetical protein